MRNGDQRRGVRASALWGSGKRGSGSRSNALWGSGKRRTAVLATLALLVALVGPSRVYLGEHWPSDVVGAYLFASLWLAGTIEAHLFLKPRLDMARAQRGQLRRQEDSHGISSHPE